MGEMNSSTQDDDKTKIIDEYVSIHEAVKRYIKEVDSNWMMEDEDEDTNEPDLPRTNSMSPVRKRLLSKQSCNSPLRLRNNSRIDNKKGLNDSLSLSKEQISTCQTKNMNDSINEINKEINEEEKTRDNSNCPEILNFSAQNLATMKMSNNASTEIIEDSSVKMPKSPSKKKRKKQKSISGLQNAIQKPTFKITKDYLRDLRREEDRRNMDDLIVELKQSRKDQITKSKGAFRISNRKTRIIKKKDIRIFGGKNNKHSSKI
jgi:hypothetical protein